MPYYAKGITSFAPATVTQPTFTGTNPNNHDIYYQIDKNDGNGFGGTWKNLAYKRAGGGGTSGTATVTMTSTTGVAVNDYVFGTGIGTNARVQSVDNATTITVTVNNSGTVSGVLVFNQLPNETGLSSAKGTKLKVKIDCNTTSASNVMTYLRIDTVTTSTAQNSVSYPLDPVTVETYVQDASTFDFIENARVIIEADSGGALPAQDSVTITRVSSTASVSHSNHGMSEGDVIVIRGADQSEYNGRFEISNVTTNAYDYTVTGSPATPATGTITATAQILSGLTDVNGYLANTEFAYTDTQPIIGKVRKASGTPNYKEGTIIGDITETGLRATVLLVGDE